MELIVGMTQSKASQASISPATAVDLLKAGNKRFMDRTPANRDLHSQVGDTSTGQYPFASVVSCIDSRIPTEIIFDQGIGDIFNARIAGNFVNPDILGSLEFACKLAGSKVIVIMGHTSSQLGNLTQMLDKIMPAVVNTTTTDGEERSSKNLDFVNRVSTANVKMTIERTKSDSPVLKAMYDAGEIDIVGAMYDVKSGKVSFL